VTTYNVRITVVELVESDSAPGAIAKLRRLLQAAGFEPYEDGDEDAFESEDQEERDTL
jgi:hypothetical protein